MLVTVYIPTKNRLDLLKLAVESVLNQTYSSIELIVVDDASTDSTRDYLTEISDKDSRVKFLFNTQSKGACVARNMAIKQANGYFITGLDDDDEFEPFHIESLVRFWGILEKSVEKFSCIYVQYKFRNNGEFSYSHKNSSIVSDDMFLANHVGNQIFSTKQKYVEAGLFDETMPAWQDLEFFYRFIKLHGVAKLLDLNSYIFDISPRGDRISQSNKYRIINSFAKFIGRHPESNSRKRLLLLLKQVFSDYYGFYLSFSDICFLLREEIPLSVIIKLMISDSVRQIKKSYFIQKIKPLLKSFL